MLHSAVHWPKGGTVEDLLKGVANYVGKLLSTADVFLIFDRYKEYSIKSNTRAERLGKLRRTYNLAIGSPLPSKDINLKTTATNVQLIRLISKYLLSVSLHSDTNFIVTYDMKKIVQNNVAREFI